MSGFNETQHARHGDGALIGLGGAQPDSNLRNFVLGVLATARPLD